MKKTSLFVFFVVFFMTGMLTPLKVVSPNKEAGYVFCTVLLIIAQIFFTLSLFHKTNSLTLKIESENFYLARVLRWGGVIGLCMSILGGILIPSGYFQKIPSQLVNFYHLTAGINILMLILTVFIIFISDDIKIKEKETLIQSLKDKKNVSPLKDGAI